MNIVNEIHSENRGRIDPHFIIPTIHPTVKIFAILPFIRFIILSCCDQVQIHHEGDFCYLIAHVSNAPFPPKKTCYN